MKTNLRSLRADRGLTATEMASMVGEDVESYLEWEDDASAFDVIQLVACADILDCSCEDIVPAE